MRQVVGFMLVVALAACTPRTFTPTVPEALAVGQMQTIFAATTRREEPGGQFGYERSEKLTLLELTVSIPPSHQPGDLSFGYANPDPRKQFVMAGRRVFDTPAAFRSRLWQSIRHLPHDQQEMP